MDFTNIGYLQKGNLRQQRAYQTLSVHQVMEKLQPFNPVLVGTIPINIDIATSDLDIICYCQQKEAFIDQLHSCFGHKKGFRLWERATGTPQEAVVASFRLDEFDIEIFGQPVPVAEQYGYRHLLTEYQLLEAKGDLFKQEIIALKQQGFKTEPAFAKALGLEGNPYEALLLMEKKC